MSNSNQSRDSSPVTRGRSVQPRSKVHRFLTKVKDGLTTKISRSNSRSRDHVLPNVDHEDASSIPNIEVQNTSSGVKQCADPQSVLREAKYAAEGMNLLSTPLRSGASTAQDAQADLEAAYGAEDTYLQPLRVFDSVIGSLADVHPYAKIALGLLSHACKIVLAQTDRDQATFRLLEKLGQVYSFMMQDNTLAGIPSMQSIIGRIVQQTLECSQFIKDYSATKNFLNW